MTLNKILRYSVLTGIFLIPFVALIVSGTFLFPSTFFPFITGKNFVFRIIVEVVTGLWLILALRDRRYAPKKSWIMWAISAFLVVMAVADLLSANPLKSFWSNFERMEGYITLLHLAAYFLVTSTMLNTQRLWNWFLHTALGASLFMSFYSILQLPIIHHVSEIAIDQGSTRVDGTLGNAAYLAVFMLINAFILIYFCISRRAKLVHIVTTYVAGFGSFLIFYMVYLREMAVAGSSASTSVHTIGISLCVVSILGIIGAIYIYFHDLEDRSSKVLQYLLYIVLIVLNVWIMIETATRGTALGFVAGILFVSVVLAFFEKERTAVRNIGRVVLALAVLSIIAFFALKNTPIVKNSDALSRLSSLATFNIVQFAEVEGGARFQIWKMALDGAKERPIFGWGQESFNYLFYKYYSPAMYNQEPWFDRAHDVFLDWLTAGGVLGLLTYLSLYAAMLYCIWYKMGGKGKDNGIDHASHSRPNSHPASSSEIPKFDLVEKTILTGLLIAYFIHNLFVFDNITSYILFFTLLAYVHSVYGQDFSFEDEGLATKSDKKNTARSQDKYAVFDDNNGMIATAVIVVCTIAAVYFINIPALENSITLVNALSPQQGGLQANLDLYQNILNSNGFFTFLGKYETREQLAELAAQVSQASASQVSLSEKQTVFNLAYGQLEDQLKETPNDLRYYYFAGTLLDAYGQFQAAQPIWQKAVELSPNRQMILISLAQVDEQLGDPADIAEATVLLKKAYDLDPSYDQAAIMYFSSSQQFDKLIPLLKGQFAGDPTNAETAFSLAAAYAQTGDKKDAISVLMDIATSSPSYAEQAKTYISQVESSK